ncbi:hypothetical protein QU670_00360 [Actinomyces massiliensis]|uniref:hypothetical protein n=1 Tax=Actinomyces massiliensis TaxID=461393 RepID=UPI0003192E53|nr:hypothetical protein [Actinomyces massiliensis]WLD71748.1 hypothetical protein QU670_00360 [Actinomyces massiliensis]
MPVLRRLRLLPVLRRLLVVPVVLVIVVLLRRHSRRRVEGTPSARRPLCHFDPT